VNLARDSREADRESWGVSERLNREARVAARVSDAPKSTLILVGILFAVILSGIDATVVSTVMPVALPELGGSHLYAWTFAAYMLATAVSMPIWGPGSDRWGRKRTFLAGLAVFVAGSVACALAPTMPWFIAARALQGVGAGAVASLPFIVLGVVFPPEKRGRALGIVSSAWAVSSVAGPLLGTLIVTHVSWRWAFLINLPVGLVAAWLVGRHLHESVGERAGAFDVPGAILAGVGGSALIWAFTRLGEGEAGLFEAALILVGLAALVAFVWQETRAASPILPLSFFRHRGYACAMGASFLAMFSGFGLSAYVPIEASALYHDALAVGLVVGVFIVGWSCSALVTSRLIHRVGERRLGVIGLGVHLAGLIAILALFGRGLPLACAATLVAGSGMGIVTPGLTVVVQNSVEVRRMGSATTSLQFTRQVGGALGVTSFVLAARLGGFSTGIYVLLAVSSFALVLASLLPATSLDAHRAHAPVAE